MKDSDILDVLPNKSILETALLLPPIPIPSAEKLCELWLINMSTGSNLSVEELRAWLKRI